MLKVFFFLLFTIICDKSPQNIVLLEILFHLFLFQLKLCNKIDNTTK